MKISLWSEETCNPQTDRMKRSIWVRDGFKVTSPTFMHYPVVCTRIYNSVKDQYKHTTLNKINL